MKPKQAAGNAGPFVRCSGSQKVVAASQLKERKERTEQGAFTLAFAKTLLDPDTPYGVDFDPRVGVPARTKSARSQSKKRAHKSRVAAAQDNGSVLPDSGSVLDEEQILPDNGRVLVDEQVLPEICVKHVKVVQVGTTARCIDSAAAAEQREQMSAYIDRGFFGYELSRALDVAVEAAVVAVAVLDAAPGVQAYLAAGSLDLAVDAQACSFFCPFSSRGGQVSGEWACESCVEDFSTAEERSEWAACIAAQAEQGEASGATSQEEAQLLFPDDSAEIANPAVVQRATQAESTDPREPVLACTGRDLAPGSHVNAVDITIITYSEPMYALGAAAGEPCSVCPINSRRGRVAGEAACESCIEWAVRIAPLRWRRAK